MKISTGKKAGTSELDGKIAEVAGVKQDDVDDVIVKKITNFDELTSLAIGDTKTPLDELCVYEIYNLNVSELVFYLIVDLPENQCIVNIIDQDGECLTELTQQLVDYALSTQLDAYGDYTEGAVDDVPVEESLLSEDGGVYAAQENVDIGQAAGFPEGDDDMFAGTGAIIDVAELGNQQIDTSDPELAFGVEILTNDDGSVSIMGNVPAVINALGGVQAEQIKGDLIGDAEDSYNKENSSISI